MNNIQSFINQQLGFAKWDHYDMALKRLTCRREEEFTSLLTPGDLSDLSISDPPIFACKFARVKGYQQILALANEDGNVAIYNTENNQRHGRQAHNNAIFDIGWMPKSMKLVTASGDHTAALFDISNERIHCERSFQCHIRSLKSVACRNDDNAVFATGGRDGRLIVWDTRASHGDVVSVPDVLIPMTHFSQGKYDCKGLKLRDAVSASSSVTGLIFKDCTSIISCGAGDGLIKVWDIRRTHYSSSRAPKPKYTLPYCGTTLRNGFSNLLMSSDGTKLYASCLDNVIYVYNVATFDPKPIMQYAGHKNSTFYVKASLSPDDKYILSGSSDNQAYIWNAENSRPLLLLTGHEAEVTCVAWCEDGSNVLITCSDDLRHKIWRVDLEVVPDDLKPQFHNRAVEVFENSHCTRFKKTYTSNSSISVNRNKITYDKFFNLCEDFHTTEKVTSVHRKKARLEILRKRKYLVPIDQNVPENDTEHLIKRIKLSLDSDNEDSITKDLPNFVIDGEAPHLYVSPKKKQEKDWLTILRMKRASSVSQVQELSRSSPSKIAKLEDGASPRSKNHKVENATTTSSSQSPLLKYFKITSSPSQNCRAKSPNCVPLSPKSQSSQ
ncbi:hypothetical protein FQR65_LT00620 [Abscondita terminalis]|nr:hypothetical protein FQR65_LT00620 [Abscondita terminalis]